jgi:TonB family protein
MSSGCERAWCFVFILTLIVSMQCSGQSKKSANEEASESEEQIYDLGPGVIPPRVVKQVNPRYSVSLRGVRVTGSVTIGVVVTSQGMPKDPHLIRGIDDEVDRAAIEALKQWRFAPARKEDKAVAVRVVVEIEFHSM